MGQEVCYGAPPFCWRDEKMRIAALCTAATLVFASAVPVGTARAQINRLEIKMPQVEAGEVELEYLGDYHFGQPRRRFVDAAAGASVVDDNDFNRHRHTLGLGYGFARWLGLQVAVEAEQARIEDAETLDRANAFADPKITEIEVEGTIVLVPAGKDGFGLAALIEHNIALDRREPDQLFLGAALQHVRGAWSATANIYAVRHFGGREERDGASISDERWDLQYAAQIKYRVSETLALALEGYGVVERLGTSGTKSDARVRFGDFDRHLAGPVLYYSWNADDRAVRKMKQAVRAHGGAGTGKAAIDDEDGDNDGLRYTLGAGLLFGLNANTADVALKWILTVEF
jgi:hypothetical protein